MSAFSPGDVSVFSFSSVYREEDFWRKLSDRSDGFRFFDFTALPGTNGYLSDDARAAMERAIDRLTGQDPSPERGASLPSGLHFIDSGNTHYMTKLFTDRIREPFALVLFDHHPDLLPPAFGGLLSCGSWLRAALTENPSLRAAYLVGVDERLAREALAEDNIAWSASAPADDGSSAALHCVFHGKPLTLLSASGFSVSSETGTALSHLVTPAISRPVSAPASPHAAPKEEALPLYLTIDKDILAESELKTNWDQGDLCADVLLSMLRALRDGVRLLGVDVCGECTPDDILHPAALSRALQQNDDFNAKVLDIFLNNA